MGREDLVPNYEYRSILVFMYLCMLRAPSIVVHHVISCSGSTVFRSSSSYDGFVFKSTISLLGLVRTTLLGCVPLFVLQAPKDPLRHGLGAALARRLVRQTDQDGLKWDLLKQVLRVRDLRSVLTWFCFELTWF